jgi:protein SCO1/2
MNSPFPEDAWKFLTGSSENIKKIAEAVGFTYKKEMHGFIHPVVIALLSPDGKITRYIHVSRYSYGAAYPVTLSPLDLRLSLADASQGKICRSDREALLYCFPHEPASEGKFFTVLKISGITTIFFIVSFLIYLKATSKRI